MINTKFLGILVAPVTSYKEKLLSEFIDRNTNHPGFTFFRGKVARMLIDDPTMHMWLWEDYGDPVAFGLVQTFKDPHKAHVGRFGVCVDASAQGKGLGKWVVNRLLSEAEILKLHKINATVYADNAAMLHIYQQLYDFEIEGRYYNEEHWPELAEQGQEWRTIISLAKFLHVAEGK